MNTPRHHRYALALLNDIRAAIGQSRAPEDLAADLPRIKRELEALSEDSRTRGEPFERRLQATLAMLHGRA